MSSSNTTTHSFESAQDNPSIPAWNPAILQKELPELKEWVPGMVVAGGALVSWAFPDVPPSAESDIDLWAFDRAAFVATVAKFRVHGNTFHFQPRNITVIRPPPLRPVQIMYYPGRNAEAVVADFDIDAVRVYYDGRQRYCHSTCVASWVHRTVWNCHGSSIPQYRLNKMRAKGFAVSLPPNVVVVAQLVKPSGLPPLASDDPTSDASQLATLVEARAEEHPWKNYHLTRVPEEPKSFVFVTDIMCIIKDNQRRLGLSRVPDELAKVMEAQTSLFYFFNVHPSTTAEQMEQLRLGPARVQVVFHGMNQDCPVFSVTDCRQ